ncbi:putative homing endonuclease [Morganella phage vB_MmoM_Rgz1]|nr:putative homing endonuclease [Morganella phage vB_MmoM_Rgz1]
MNYKKIYDNLIKKGLERGLNKTKLDYYTERHHIVPRCLGGNDDTSNLVLLTAEEHFIAHRLLSKIYPSNYKIIMACIAMGMKSPTHERHYNKSYGDARRKMAELQTGKGNPFYGKRHSQEFKDKLSSLYKGRKCTWKDKVSKTKQENPRLLSDEEKLVISIRNSGSGNYMYGKTHTAEARAKISKAAKERFKDPSKNPAAKKCRVNGKEYGSIKQASEDTGLSKHLIRKLLKG